MSKIDQLRLAHTKKHGVSPQVFVMAPGRINIIGEHTDYNLGYVLPTAINKYIYFTISIRTDLMFNIYAKDLEKEYHFNIENQDDNESYQWYHHITGVIKEFIKRGLSPTFGLDISYCGDIPLGSGLSSSAAVESGIACAINQIFHFNLPKIDLAIIAQDTEHNHIGVKCGIMDMYASIFSKKDYVLQLDCKSLTHKYAPLHIEGYRFVLVNSGVKHSLADSAYNQRRNQCEQGVAYFKTIDPQIESLRDVTISMIEQSQTNIDSLIWQRCKYVVEENLRVLSTIRALENNDIKEVGSLLYESHYGLSKEYEVSCEELDYLIDLVKDLPYAAGARMMGGGFGGCTINLVENDHLDKFKDEIKSKYIDKYGIDPDVIEVENSEGVRVF